MVPERCMGGRGAARNVPSGCAPPSGRGSCAPLCAARTRVSSSSRASPCLLASSCAQAEASGCSLCAQARASGCSLGPPTRACRSAATPPSQLFGRESAGAAAAREVVLKPSLLGRASCGEDGTWLRFASTRTAWVKSAATSAAHSNAFWAGMVCSCAARASAAAALSSSISADSRSSSASPNTPSSASMPGVTRGCRVNNVCVSAQPRDCARAWSNGMTRCGLTTASPNRGWPGKTGSTSSPSSIARRISSSSSRRFVPSSATQVLKGWTSSNV